MSVPTSESSASTPSPSVRKPFPPQTQFVHIVVSDMAAEEYGLVDFRGDAIFRTHNAGEVIQKAIERSIGKGPILIMNGDYLFDSINAHDISICGTGVNNTVLAGEIKCSNATFSNFTFSGQKWSNAGHFTIKDCDIPSLEIKGDSGRISDSNVNSLTIDGANIFITRNKIHELKANGRRFVISENIIESAEMNVAESTTSNNVLGHYTRHYTKTENIPITAASGGTQFPNLETSSVTVFVPHVTFKGQIGEPIFYIGNESGAPYFDRETYPQSLGYPLTSPHQKLEFQDINLNEIRAVSSISGAFLSYFATI